MKKHSNIIIATIFLLIIIPLTLTLILRTPSSIGIVNPLDVGGLIGYYGSILGGALTLIGVWATLKHHEKSERKERSIQFKPILDIANNSKAPALIPTREVRINVPGYSDHTRSSPPKYISQNEKRKETFFLVLQNKGRGETANAVLKSFKPVFKNINWTEEHQLHSSSGEMSLGEIVSNDHLKILIHLPQYLLVKKESVAQNEKLYLNTVMKIQYSDMFEETKYEYTIHKRYSIELDKSDSEEIGSDYLAVRAKYTLDQVMPERKIMDK